MSQTEADLVAEAPDLPAEAGALLLGQKIATFPDLAPQIRAELWRELALLGQADEAALEARARRLAARPPTIEPGLAIFTPEQTLAMAKNALLDALAARHLSDELIDEIINFVRKHKRAQALKLALGRTNPSGPEVMRRLKEFCELPLGEKRIAPSELLGIRAALIDNFISSHLPFLGVAKNHLTIRGLCDLTPYIIGRDEGAGRIGAKSAGLLLTMAVLHPALVEWDPDFMALITSPRSYYLRSDVFDAIKEANQNLDGFMDHKYKDLEQIAREYPLVIQSCLQSRLPPEIEGKIAHMLEELGERPLVVRSSSYLEDSSNFAFSGKYKSVFVANQGPLPKRLAEFKLAMMEVYASTFSPEVMSYRRERGLLDFNERMCLLVQEVVGRRHGDYFYPLAAGVATSRNNYAWTRRIRREDGLLRLVMGLGTRAVERVGPDYARMVPLSAPLLRPEATAEQVFRYSQKFVDVLNLTTNRVESVPLKAVAGDLRQPEVGQLLSVERGGVLTRPLTRVDPGRERACLTFEGLLGQGKFSQVMKRALKALEKALEQPVEVEFALEGGKIYVLQCRPLSQYQEAAEVSIPDHIPPERVLFTSRHGFSSAVLAGIEVIVYVDPAAYQELATGEARMAVAAAVGRLNQALKGRPFILMGPGRWGSNNLELGVKVTHADISHARMLLEVAWSVNGAVPDVSYGTHFFHDLVESNIIPLPVYPGSEGTVFNQAFFAQNPAPPEPLGEVLAGAAGVVKVFDLPRLTGGRRLKVLVDGAQPFAIGYLD